MTIDWRTHVGRPKELHLHHSAFPLPWAFTVRDLRDILSHLVVWLIRAAGHTGKGERLQNSVGEEQGLVGRLQLGWW